MHSHSAGEVSRRRSDRDGTGPRGQQRQQVDMSRSAGVVSVYVIYPRQGCFERALEVLREVVEHVRGGHLGLLRTRLYRSLDGKTLATHAEWRSKSQHDAVLRDDEFVRRFNQLRELGIYESHVYEIADDVYAIPPEIERT
jgi:quinol monooxygenase YgiN